MPDLVLTVMVWCLDSYLIELDNSGVGKDLGAWSEDGECSALS